MVKAAAALTLRLLAGVAVIARSFVWVHETNLKKQGLLALKFEDPPTIRYASRRPGQLARTGGFGVEPVRDMPDRPF